MHFMNYQDTKLLLCCGCLTYCYDPEGTYQISCNFVAKYLKYPVFAAIDMHA